MKKILLIAFVIVTTVAKAQINFDPYVTYPTGSAFHFVESGDIDGDGDLDLVGATTFGNDPVNDYMLVIWINNNGTLASPIKIPYGGVTGSATGITLEDLDGDGKKEIIFVVEQELQVWKYYNNNNIVNQFFTVTGNTIDGVSVGDLDGDGRKDIAVSHWNSPWISVLYNENNNFSFTKIDYPMVQGGYDQILIGRLDNDNYNSLIYMRGQGLENDIEILRIGSNRAIQETKHLNLLDPTAQPHGIALGNPDGSTNRKLAITSGGNMPNAWYSLSNGNMLQNTMQTFHNPQTVRFGNLIGDNRDELVILHGGYQTLSVHNMLTYQVTYFDVPYASHYQPTEMTIGDFNNDGKPDIALANYLHGLIILYNTSILAVDDVSRDIAISIYPNPATDYISVKTKEKIKKLELYDLSGRKVKEKFSTSQMNISEKTPGTYVLRVELTNGENFSTKIIKQ